MQTQRYGCYQTSCILIIAVELTTMTMEPYMTELTTMTMEPYMTELTTMTMEPYMTELTTMTMEPPTSATG